MPQGVTKQMPEPVISSLPLTQSEKLKYSVFENEVLRTIFGPKSD
jgi:hypothetical protein